MAVLTVLPVISACDGGPPPAPKAVLDSPAAVAAGRALFAAHCAICHGTARDGQGRRRAGMNPAPADLTLPPWSDRDAAGRTFLAIRNGVAGTAMPPWPSLGDQQIWQLVAYLTAAPKS